MNKKQGNSILITPVITVFLITVIIIVGVQSLNYIEPFIYYEKLNNLALKYLFIIQKYGYLTDTEVDNLKLDLQNSGFDLNQISVEYPQSNIGYGNLISFSIKYNLYIKNISFQNNIKVEQKPIILNVKKSCYAKR